MIYRIRTQYNNDINDEDMMIHVLNNLTSEYDDLALHLEMQLDNLHFPLTLEVLKVQIQTRFDKKNKANSMRYETGFNVNHNKSNKTCTYCKKLGHMYDQCWKREENKHLMPTCGYCKHSGHSTERCNKRRYKGKGTTNNAKNADVGLMACNCDPTTDNWIMNVMLFLCTIIAYVLKRVG